MPTRSNGVTHQANEKPLRDAIRQIDKASQDAFTRIATLSRSANQLIGTGDTPGVKQDISTLLELLLEVAQDAENFINATAEGVGCNWVDEPSPVVIDAAA